MEWGNISTIAFAVSAASLFIRWRWPVVPHFVASAGLGASLAVVTLSLFGPAIPLAVSIALNSALLAGVIDYWLSQPAKTALADAKSASLTLSFTSAGPPTEVSNLNVHSWYSTSLQLTAVAADGQKQRHLFNQWATSLWFAEPVYDYLMTFESLSGEPLDTSVQWRSERGAQVMISAPDQPSVIRIRVEQRLGA